MKDQNFIVEVLMKNSSYLLCVMFGKMKDKIVSAIKRVPHVNGIVQDKSEVRFRVLGSTFRVKLEKIIES